MTVEITVIGGSYAEECSFPRSIVYRGSGMRAASVLAGLGNRVILDTVNGPRLRTEFADICARKKITAQVTTADSDVWFRYRHPLSKPDIYPSTLPKTSDRAEVNADCVLVFGMIEGRPKVTARRVIYDPQDGCRAKPFAENGSSSSELVILASLSEGRALTGKHSAEEIANELLASSSCVAVVIKCGPQGALVATASVRKWVGAFSSAKMWKIGSGDIFSAAFAHKWFAESATVLEAAWFASRMVAEYVSTRLEVFKAERMKLIRSDASDAMEAAARTTDQPMPRPNARIYLAGPFFTTAQQWLVDEARFALRELGFEVFSPIHEIGEGPPNEVVPADIFALEHSDLVFALVDGLDAGTIFEIGYARARDIPVVCLAESVDSKSLTMLLGSGCEIFSDFATSIYAACWQLIHYV
jgi:nucleoside 2-deoxyribosyltransferase